MEYETRKLRLDTGQVPFEEWLDGLGDPDVKARILAAVKKMEVGNFGGARSIKGSPGLFEYRVNAGPGYRIYYRLKDRTVVLLWGGTKGTQTRDIERASLFAKRLDSGEC